MLREDIHKIVWDILSNAMQHDMIHEAAINQMVNASEAHQRQLDQARFKLEKLVAQITHEISDMIGCNPEYKMIKLLMEKDNDPLSKEDLKSLSHPTHASIRPSVQPPWGP